MLEVIVWSFKALKLLKSWIDCWDWAHTSTIRDCVWISGRKETIDLNGKVCVFIGLAWRPVNISSRFYQGGEIQVLGNEKNACLYRSFDYSLSPGNRMIGHINKLLRLQKDISTWVYVKRGRWNRHTAAKHSVMLLRSCCALSKTTGDVLRAVLMEASIASE